MSINLRSFTTEYWHAKHAWEFHGGKKRFRIIICVLLQIIVSEFCFALGEELYILNNSLFVGDTEVVVLHENQEASYYELGNLYLILVNSYNPHEEYSFIYDTKKDEKIYLDFNVSTYFNVYFWNSILIYRVKLKSGGCVLFDTKNRKQTLLHEWIEDFYTINDELCILTTNEYKCLTNDKRYKKNMSSMRLPALVKKEVSHAHIKRQLDGCYRPK